MIGSSVNYEGCYADVDGDGNPDGIIFADLAYDEEYDWGIISGVEYNLNEGHLEYYNWSAIESSELRSYEISQASYTYTNDVYGTHPVIAEIDGTERKERFYVVAFEDLKVGDYTTFYWYYNAYGSLVKSDTSMDFGYGKTNTVTMVEQWNDNGDGIGGDLWGEIQKDDNYKNGWFVPSCRELAAMLTNLGVTKANYIQYGFSSAYLWSSTIENTYLSYLVRLSNGLISDNYVTNIRGVRLITTF